MNCSLPDHSERAVGIWQVLLMECAKSLHITSTVNTRESTVLFSKGHTKGLKGLFLAP